MSEAIPADPGATMLAFVRRTPNRTFVLYPALVLGAQMLVQQGRPRLAWRYAPLLAWGYLQYRLCGGYRRARGGGGPGIDVPPEDLITTGPYAVVRNPMYLGHLIFLAGVWLFARSWLGLLLLTGTAWWFHDRVGADEQRLADQFGEPYREYQARVSRWIPGLL
jgi:hypothetical protein